MKILVGFENLAKQFYQLSPLTLTLITAPSRVRSFIAQLRWSY
ncbi:MAG: hypothetical protein U1G08_13070 [Verrucomicrobiota bacterium]